MASISKTKNGNAPLPPAAQIAVTVIGAVVTVGSYLLTQSGSTASLVATVLLLMLIGQQRRLGRNSSHALMHWSQLPNSVWPTIFGIGALTVGVATLLGWAANAGWAAAVIFVGAATIADAFARAGAKHYATRSDCG